MWRTAEILPPLARLDQSQCTVTLIRGHFYSFTLLCVCVSDELMDAGNRSKTLDVIVTPAINCELNTTSFIHSFLSLFIHLFIHSLCVFVSSADVYVMGMLFCLGIFLSFYLLTFLVACVENKR